MKNLLLLLFISLFVFKLNANELEQKKIDIIKNLRCLVCQGQSIADSNSDFAQTIKLVVSDKVLEGKSEKEIYDFLISKYGEWIVFKPELSKTNFALWIIPYLVLFFGGIIIFIIVKKRDIS